MKLKQKLLLGPLLIWLATFLIPLVAFAPKASALEIKSDKICVPHYTKTADGKDYKVDGWLNVSFLNRASIKIVYQPNGNCVTPASLDSSFFEATKDPKTGGDITWAEIMNKYSGEDSTLILTDGTDSSNFNYQSNDPGNGPTQDDTRIDNFGSTPKDMMDAYDSGVDAKVDLNSLAVFLQKVWVIMAFESDQVGTSCDSTLTDPNYTLYGDGKVPHWDCNDSNDLSNSKGLVIGVNNMDISNFNITYAATQDQSGTIQVKSVYSQAVDGKTFVQCGGSYFANSKCNGSNLILLNTDGSRANTKDITDIGSGTKDFIVAKFDQGNNKIDTSKESTVVVSGIDNPSSCVGSDCIPSQQTQPAGCANSDTTCQYTSACVSIGHTSLEWLFCPVITAIGDATDEFNNVIQSQLSFDVNGYLPDNGSVHQAWSIIKNVVSALLVIILLVMVISQAVGKGPFEAYTIKKILPKLVIAAIAMQISWDLAKLLITYSNDLGNGVTTILTAPFGGQGNLDLVHLISRLGTGWLIGVSAVSIAGVGLLGLALVSGVGKILAPGVLLLAFLLFMAVIVGLATLIFRNVLIVMSVIFMPLGLLLWIMPSQTMQGYWKNYSSNFTKLLLLFPLFMAVIWSGRIFAWITGNLGLPGLMDFIMLLVGYFGPYFYLPKLWKAGGSWMRAGADAIATNGALTGGRKFGKDFLWGLQKDKARLYGKENINPGADDYAKATKKIMGVPVRWSGNLPKTAAQNLIAGRWLPTKRALAQSLKEQNEASSTQDALAMEQVKRIAEMAEKQGGTTRHTLKDDGTVVAVEAKKGPEAMKAALLEIMGSGNARMARAANELAIATGTWPEIGSQAVSISDAATRDEMLKSGATVFKADGTRYTETDAAAGTAAYATAYEMDDWRRALDTRTGEGLFAQTNANFVLAAPHISHAAYGADIDAKIASGEVAAEEGVAAGQRMTEADRAHMMIDGYLNPQNINGQSEAEWKTLSRIGGKTGSGVINTKDPETGDVIKTTQGQTVSAAFGQKLLDFAAGGVGAETTLGNLDDGGSQRGTLNGLLAKMSDEERATIHAAMVASGARAADDTSDVTIQQYVDHAKRLNRGPGVPAGGGGDGGDTVYIDHDATPPGGTERDSI